MDIASWNASIPLIITLGLGFFGIWFAIRTEALRLRAEMREVRAELKADIREVRTELKADIGEVRIELKADIHNVDGKIDGAFIRVDGKIDGAFVRVSDAEIRQAEMRGAMSVLRAQSHTHETDAPSGD